VDIPPNSAGPGEWRPASWQAFPARQQPNYRDRAALDAVVEQLSRLPPVVVSWEVERLLGEFAAAQRGDRFLLQGGDCAESFDDCDSSSIAQRLKILLQMSLVLVHGLKRPIIRVGRMAGQYAKPRSTDTETRDGVTLPSYRGDIVNRPEFTEQAREPDPTLLLRGYERAALTLNFIRALIDEIRLVPEDGRLGIVLRGDLAAILAFANAKKNPRLDDETGVQVTLVAGARYMTYLTPPLRVPLVA